MGIKKKVLKTAMRWGKKIPKEILVEAGKVMLKRNLKRLR